MDDNQSRKNLQKLTDSSDWKRDVFLSHANLDKEQYIKPIVNLLEQREISYWLDEAEIRWGHSIVKLISEGLETSRFVLVFISRKFLSRPWPEAELRAALSKEISTGEIRVLPVFICNPEDALSKHPFLRDKKWLTWDQDCKHIVENLEELLGRKCGTDWCFEHPAQFRGHVWIKVMPRLENVGSRHQFRIRWGRWLYESYIDFIGVNSHILDFKKIAESETWPLHFEISPPAFVTAGRGKPVRDINRGWKCIEKKGRVKSTVSKAIQLFLRNSTDEKVESS